MRYRLALAILCVAAPLSAATFTVTTTADARNIEKDRDVFMWMLPF